MDPVVLALELLEANLNHGASTDQRLFQRHFVTDKQPGGIPSWTTTIRLSTRRPSKMQHQIAIPD